MLAKGALPDGMRISVSSLPSTSSHGSTQEDFDASEDVYVWGEVLSDSSSRASADKNSIFSTTMADVLLPKPIESNLILDIHHVACGVRHAALVTKQGEVFTWGEESGGRLGHGVACDSVRPRLVETLTSSVVDYVACGEFHTCAVTVSGELYTWGDGTHNTGLLGNGTSVSHWIPKRVSGLLEGLQVSYVSCGVWHTALITVTGQLFTFGDGAFGVLGHGNRETVLYPKEVESLMGLKTIAVSCGVWHTAAVVEVMATHSNTPSGKLFTWGDGDKYRLGHGDNKPRLKPTCVPSLIDYNFQKLACGCSLTIGSTTSGHIFTMGSTIYGQLGNPRSDGKLPCLVEDKLVGESVAEVACGSFHVAVLTVKGQVYTWGRGANGRLGHGDLDDRKEPSLVEALKDRQVKHISCGSTFTAAICQHKWVSAADQSQCSSCRQAFGFTRKRHNCYNCGLVHCHQCSSRKALRTALSLNPEKPYRVCDSCYLKLTNSFDSYGCISKKISKPRISGEGKDKFDKMDTSWSKPSSSSNSDFGIDSEDKVSIHGLYLSKGFIEDTKKTNDLLNQELLKLHSEVDNLRQRCVHLEVQLEKSDKKAQESAKLAAEESAKSTVAKEVIKSLAAQLKEMAKRLPHGLNETDPERFMHLPNGNWSESIQYSDSSSKILMPNDELEKTYAARDPGHAVTSAATTEHSSTVGQNGSQEILDTNMRHDDLESPQSGNNQVEVEVEAEWIEQFEPGVYLTLIALRDGTRELKRVRFSRKKFGEQQAEVWWSANAERVHEKYKFRMLNGAS
ncbi:PH, RCC1 and FYVE domains-containing protein 1-like [Curcuma longa]|uniref:PH, RCC1 and FYVE domains-containing protein 1-like n=1 Tax=Curcuma longa TaxID=136217 RepID=UPI003D9F0EE8